MLYAAGNGTIELATGTFRAGRADDYLSLQSTVPCDPHADCPRFLEALNECLAPNAEDLVPFIKRWFGYSLTGLTREQAFLCWWGAGANGKSVLADVQMTLMGEYGLGANYPASVDRICVASICTSTISDAKQVRVGTKAGFSCTRSEISSGTPTSVRPTRI